MATIIVSASLLKSSVAHKINNIRSMPIKLGQIKKPSLQLQRTSFKLRAAAEKKDSDDKYLETRANILLEAREFIKESLEDKSFHECVAEVLKCSDGEFIDIAAKRLVEYVEESKRRRAAKKKDSDEEYKNDESPKPPVDEGGEALMLLVHLLSRAFVRWKDYLTEVEKREREAVHESMTDCTEEMVYFGEVSTKPPVESKDKGEENQKVSFETHPEVRARVRAFLRTMRKLRIVRDDDLTEDEEREIVNFVKWVENFRKDNYPIVEVSPEPTVEGKAKDEEK